jgi:hypothetical protein
MKRTDPQVNIRLPRAQFEILEAAAFAQRATAAILLTEVAEDAIDEWAKEGPTRSALRARQEADASESQKVSPIGRQRTD